MCAESTSKHDRGYLTDCGSICSAIDDRHILCNKKDIEKYCSGKNHSKTKCSRYCAKANNAHNLCKTVPEYSKSYIDERCDKYCNRTSKNFSDEKCNEECGGQFDLYNQTPDQDVTATSTDPQTDSTEVDPLVLKPKALAIPDQIIVQSTPDSEPEPASIWSKIVAWLTNLF